MSMPTINPDEQNRRAQMLAQMGQQQVQNTGTKLQYEGRSNGSKKQLVGTVIGVAAAALVLFLLAYFKII